MLTLLRKAFIHNYRNVEDESVRSKHGVLASSVGIVTNLILVLIKAGLALFLAYQSQWTILPMALLVDAANNLSDLASSIVTIISFKVAGKPADEKHPFGHERAEYVSALIVSCLILFIAFESVSRSLDQIILGQRVSYDLLTIILLVVSILLKLFQGYCYRGLGKAIKSRSLAVSAFDSLSDAVSTSAVLIGAVLSLTLGWDFLDGYLGLAIGVLIFIGGLRLLLNSLDPIIGGKSDVDYEQRIREIASDKPEVLGIHDVLCHSYGPTSLYISFHLELSDALSLNEAHAIADSLERAISKALHAEVTIHVDPVALGDQESAALKERFVEALAKYDPSLNLHDFRLIRSPKGTKLSFDILVPFNYPDDKKEEISSLLNALLSTLDGTYRLYIHYDHPF